MVGQQYSPYFFTWSYRCCLRAWNRLFCSRRAILPLRYSSTADRRFKVYSLDPKDCILALLIENFFWNIHKIMFHTKVHRICILSSWRKLFWYWGYSYEGWNDFFLPFLESSLRVPFWSQLIGFYRRPYCLCRIMNFDFSVFALLNYRPHHRLHYLG